MVRNTDLCERRLRWVSYSKHLLNEDVIIAVTKVTRRQQKKNYLEDLAKLIIVWVCIMFVKKDWFKAGVAKQKYESLLRWLYFAQRMELLMSFYTTSWMVLSNNTVCGYINLTVFQVNGAFCIYNCFILQLIIRYYCQIFVFLKNYFSIQKAN